MIRMTQPSTYSRFSRRIAVALSAALLCLSASGQELPPPDEEVLPPPPFSDQISFKYEKTGSSQERDINGNRAVRVVRGLGMDIDAPNDWGFWFHDVGSARYGSDYRIDVHPAILRGNFVFVPAGISSMTLTIHHLDDNCLEGEEAVVLILVPDGCCSMQGNDTIEHIITDGGEDDPGPAC